MDQELPGTEISQDKAPDVAPISEPVGKVSEDISSKAAVEAPAADAWQPNYKFKVRDQEKEIDEFFRPFIKDKTSEEKFKDVFTKAHGLEEVVSHRDRLKNEFQTVQSEFGEFRGAVESIVALKNEPDLGQFFQAVGLPIDRVMKYALHVAQLENLPPEQKAQYDASQQAQQQARYYQQQNERLMAEHQQYSVQQRAFELETAISRPEYKSLAEAFNKGMGNDSAFKDLCTEIGYERALVHKQDLSADQVAAEAARRLRAINPSLGMQQQVSQVVNPSQKPVIPNIQGRGTSAVRPSINSLKDIEKIRQSKYGDATY